MCFLVVQPCQLPWQWSLQWHSLWVTGLRDCLPHPTPPRPTPKLVLTALTSCSPELTLGELNLVEHCGEEGLLMEGWQDQEQLLLLQLAWVSRAAGQAHWRRLAVRVMGTLCLSVNLAAALLAGLKSHLKRLGTGISSDTKP